MTESLTVEEVERRIAKLHDPANTDDAGCHFEEDRIRTDVLQAIADGHPDPAGLATAALKTAEAVFSRWYA